MAKTRSAGESSALNGLIGYQLRRASVCDLQGAVGALRPTGLRTVPLSVLVSIVERPGLSAAQICRTLGLQRANIVAVLADLEGRGLVTRTTDPKDSRVFRLEPTEAGRAEASRALDLLARHEARMLARLSPAEQAELRRLLALLWDGHN